MNYLKKEGVFGHVGFDRSIILIWILLKMIVRLWTERVCLRTGISEQIL